MAHPNEELITKFYTAFTKKDYKLMASCYAEKLSFSDPVFGNLSGNKAKAMWRMLVEKSKDLNLTFSNVKADDTTGSADWVAEYTFAKTNRKIVNHIHAKFTFEKGLMITHKDSFNFWKWCGMALGTKGYLLAPFLKGSVKKDALSGLDLFIRRNKIVI